MQNRRLEEGQASTLDILDNRRRLYEAQSRELSAVDDLNKSIVQLWVANGTLLRQESIMPVDDDREGPGPSSCRALTAARPPLLASLSVRMKIKRALLSVSDKTGLVEFARELAAAGVEIISTGGTAALLKKEKIASHGDFLLHRLPRDHGRAGEDPAPEGPWRAALPARQRKPREAGRRKMASSPSISSS